jgi:hypothetical protein
MKSGTSLAILSEVNISVFVSILDLFFVFLDIHLVVVGIDKRIITGVVGGIDVDKLYRVKIAFL